MYFPKCVFDITDGLEELNNYDPDYNLLYNVELNNPSDYFDIQSLGLHQENSFGIYFHNLRSFKANFESFEIDHLPLLKNNFQVFGFTETKIENGNENQYFIQNYNLFANNKSGHSGGVCMYVHNDITCKQISNLTILLDHFESIFIECTIESKKVMLGVIYRRPNTKVDDFMLALSDVLNILRRKKCKCYVMGDFNLNLFSYDSNHDVQNFINCMYSHGFYNTINRPTRVTSHSATLIDNIFTNDLNDYILNGILLTDLSDHYAPFNIIKTVKFIQPETVTVTYRDYNFTEPDVIRNTFVEHIQNVNFDFESVDTSFDKLSDTLESVSNLCFPVKTKVITSKNI